MHKCTQFSNLLISNLTINEFTCYIMISPLICKPYNLKTQKGPPNETHIEHCLKIQSKHKFSAIQLQTLKLCYNVSQVLHCMYIVYHYRILKLKSFFFDAFLYKTSLMTNPFIMRFDNKSS